MLVSHQLNGGEEKEEKIFKKKGGGGGGGNRWITGFEHPANHDGCTK